MTRIGRRALILSTIATAVAAGGGVLLLPDSKVQAVLRVVRDQFGEDIAAAPAATDFAEAFVSSFLTSGGFGSDLKYLAFGKAPSWILEMTDTDDIFQQWVVFEFIRGTTAVRAYETGERLEFLGVASNQEEPCTNPLSVHWL